MKLLKNRKGIALSATITAKLIIALVIGIILLMLASTVFLTYVVPSITATLLLVIGVVLIINATKFVDKEVQRIALIVGIAFVLFAMIGYIAPDVLVGLRTQTMSIIN